MSRSPQPSQDRGSFNFRDLPTLFRDSRFWKIAGQVIAVVVVVTVVAVLVDNLFYNLRRLGLTPGFSFLGSPSSFDIGEKLIEYGRADSYGRAIVVGLLNSLLVMVLGIILATVLGVLAGIARLSDNWLLRNLALVYVTIFRNTPLLLQLFFWYFAVFLRLPPLENRISILGSFLLTGRGIFIPWLTATSGTEIWLILLLLGLVGAAGVWRWRSQLQLEQGIPGRSLLWATGVVTATALVALIVTRTVPFLLSLPQVTDGAGVTGGFRISPEFCAVLTGLVVFTGSFIAEIVRAGIQAVPRGQWEAASALGLKASPLMQLVVLPQALRVIVPSLTSQYLNLAKNSSLAIAVGFPDLYLVASTTFNQTGRAVEVVLLIAITYLTISLFISLVMNFFNQRVQLKER